MEKLLNEILVALNSENFNEAKKDILDGLEYLSDILVDVSKDIDKRLIENIQSHNYDNVPQYTEINKKIDKLKKLIDNYFIFKEDNDGTLIVEVPYENKHKDELSLKDDLSFKIPTKIRIGNDEIVFKSKTWKNMIYSVYDYFAKKNMSKVIEFANIANQKKLTCFYFSRQPNEKNQLHELPNSNWYMYVFGDSNFIGLHTLEIIEYFGYGDNYGIYVEVREHNDNQNIKNISIPQKKESDEPKKISLNTRISHKKYGAGRIAQITEDYIFIEFDDKAVGTKQLSKSYINSNYISIL